MRLVLSTLIFGLTLSAQAPTERLQSAAYGPSPLMSQLRELCDSIGGRVTGSTAHQRALQWGLEGFKAAGVSAKLEAFSMPARWEAGKTSALVVGSSSFVPRVTPWGWSSNLSGEFTVIDGGFGSTEEIHALGAKAKGALVYIRTNPMLKADDLFAEYMATANYVPALKKLGAAGILSQSTRPLDLLYRHTEIGEGQISLLPEILIAREDGARLARMFSDEAPVKFKLEMNNVMGPRFESHNVVAELPGKEKRDEILLIGAHLDSWDLGTGALDNGCNAAMVIELARILKSTQPKRTIRFALFSGEEQGMIGSHGYVERHREELDRHRGVIIYDIGIGRVSGFSMGGRTEWQVALDQALAPLGEAAPSQHSADAFVGTDNLDFLLEGIPNLVANQDFTAYLPNYHARSDTFDKIDPRDLKNQTAEAAILLWGLANADQLPKRQTRPEIQATLKATKLDEQLKTFGYWEAWDKGLRGRK
jgi:carboxypeptidase Q